MTSEPPTERCSLQARAAAEPLIGTAPTAAAWIAVEHPGPWGPVAPKQVPGLPTELLRRAAQFGARVVLIRRPGRAGGAPAAHRTALLASTAPGAGWLTRIRFTDPEQLLELDLAALRGPTPGPLGEPDPGTVLLVCAHGRRDRCCAIDGRALAAALTADAPTAEVWECTHLGGHRFAPTTLLLPYGLVHGALNEASALAALRAAEQGQVSIDGYRGRSTWTPAGQLAEAAVRTHADEYDADALTVLSCAPARPDTTRVTVAHRDGRHWQVDVDEHPAPRPTAPSCGKPALTRTHLALRAVTPLTPTPA
ncbi:sucrase ferredoxin [Kitasatospora sp. NPDC050543]|uniref:sucrase ferredoxin n=1 Tax=Kitasatospora sp. NPDC050543 TaxID=3364054 RepID=UPI0037892E8F